MKFIPYAYSKISCYNTCPRKFKFSYIDKIKVFSQNKALEKGTRVHQIIELWHPKMYEKNLPLFNYSLLDEDEQKNVEKLALDFCKSDLGIEYLLHPGSLGHEIHMGLDKRLQPTNYHNPEALLRGKIDYLIKTGDTVKVVDWKTGKVPDQMYMDNKQVMLYAIWVFNMFKDVEVVMADYVYVEHNERYTFSFTKEFYKNYTKTYADNIKKIEIDNEFEKNPGVLCNWCDFKENCK